MLFDIFCISDIVLFSRSKFGKPQLITTYDNNTRSMLECKHVLIETDDVSKIHG